MIYVEVINVLIMIYPLNFPLTAHCSQSSQITIQVTAFPKVLDQTTNKWRTYSLTTFFSHNSKYMLIFSVSWLLTTCLTSWQTDWLSDGQTDWLTYGRYASRYPANLSLIQVLLGWCLAASRTWGDPLVNVCMQHRTCSCVREWIRFGTICFPDAICLMSNRLGLFWLVFISNCLLVLVLLISSCY